MQTPSLYILQSKKTIIVLSILLVLFLIIGWVIVLKAKSQPQQVSLSSVSSNSFTVTMFTEWKTRAKLLVADNPEFMNAMEFNDERDSKNNGEKNGISARTTHVLVARALEPDTRYYYKVKTTFNEKYEENFFSFKTPAVDKTVKSPDPVYGEVRSKDGKPKKNVIIELYAEKQSGERSSVLSTYTTDTGTYSLDLANLRTASFEKLWEERNANAEVNFYVYAMSLDEKYFYTLSSKSELTPVKTFMFKKNDSDHADSNSFAKVVPVAHAEVLQMTCDEAYDGNVARCCTQKTNGSGACANEEQWSECAAEADQFIQNCSDSGKKSDSNNQANEALLAKGCHQAPHNPHEWFACIEYVRADGSNVEECDAHTGGKTGKYYRIGEDLVLNYCGPIQSQLVAAPEDKDNLPLCGENLHCNFLVDENGNVTNEPVLNGGTKCVSKNSRETWINSCCKPGEIIENNSCVHKNSNNNSSNNNESITQPRYADGCKQAPHSQNEWHKCLDKVRDNGDNTQSCDSQGGLNHTYQIGREHCPGTDYGDNQASPEEETDATAPSVPEEQNNARPAAPSEAMLTDSTCKPVDNKGERCEIVLTWSDGNRDVKYLPGNTCIENGIHNWSCTKEVAVIEQQESRDCQVFNLVNTETRLKESQTRCVDQSKIQADLGATSVDMFCGNGLIKYTAPTGNSYCVNVYSYGSSNVAEGGACTDLQNSPGYSVYKYKSDTIAIESLSCFRGLVCKPTTLGSPLEGYSGVCTKSSEQEGYGVSDMPECGRGLHCKALPTNLVGGFECLRDDDTRNDDNTQPSSCCPPGQSIGANNTCIVKSKCNYHHSPDECYCDEGEEKTKTSAGDYICRTPVPVEEPNTTEVATAVPTRTPKPTSKPTTEPTTSLPKCATNVFCRPALEGSEKVKGSVHCQTSGGREQFCCRNNNGIAEQIKNNACVDPSSPIVLSTLPSKVYAQDQSLTEVNTGDVVDPGRYTIEDEGVTLNLLSPSIIEFYVDKNGNGVKDEGETIVSNKTYQLIKQKESFSYTVVNGWNALNFPFFKDAEHFFSASDIISQAKGQGIEIISIKKWFGKWVEYTVDGSASVYGKDFSVKPNEGYFVLTKSAGTFSVLGTTPNEPFPQQILNGWSLVGVAPGYGENKQIMYKHSEFSPGVKAFKYIKVVNQSDSLINLNNVTRYDSGVYRGVNYTEGKDGKIKEFGLDFKMDAMQAYFVRAEKKTVFTP